MAEDSPLSPNPVPPQRNRPPTDGSMEELRITTAAEIDLPTFRERLSQEVVANDSVIIGRSEVGAWTRVQ